MGLKPDKHSGDGNAEEHPPSGAGRWLCCLDGGSPRGRLTDCHTSLHPQRCQASQRFFLTGIAANPAKNRLHDYEAGWLTLLVEMGVATKKDAHDAMCRVAQAAIDKRRERRWKQERE